MLYKYLISESTHARYIIWGADPLTQQTISDLPGEDRGALPLVLRDLADHLRGGHARLGAADCARPDGPGLVVPAVVSGYELIKQFIN